MVPPLVWKHPWFSDLSFLMSSGPEKVMDHIQMRLLLLLLRFNLVCAGHGQLRSWTAVSGTVPEPGSDFHLRMDRPSIMYICSFLSGATGVCCIRSQLQKQACFNALLSGGQRLLRLLETPGGS